MSLLKLKVKLDHTREFVQLPVWRRVDRVSTGVVLYYFLGRPLREPVKRERGRMRACVCVCVCV